MRKLLAISQSRHIDGRYSLRNIDRRHIYASVQSARRKLSIAVVQLLYIHQFFFRIAVRKRLRRYFVGPFIYLSVLRHIYVSVEVFLEETPHRRNMAFDDII